MPTPDDAPDATPAGPDLDAILGEVRARAGERRQSGAYPPGLEHDLDVHFRHIVEHRPVRDLESVHKAMAAFEERLTFDTAGIPTGSQVPGGEILHRSVSKLVTRQTGWLARQLQDFAESVRVILWKMIETLDNPTHVHGELTAELDAVLDRLAYYERAPADAAMLGAILQRLEALEAAGRGTAGAPGPEVGELATALKGCTPVLALGAASWIPVLLDTLTAGGGEARAAAAAELVGAEAGSLGGVVLANPAVGAAEEQLRITGAALRAGGVLVVDGAPPLHPAELAFAARQLGFADVSVTWRPAPPATPAAWVLVATR